GSWRLSNRLLVFVKYPSTVPVILLPATAKSTPKLVPVVLSHFRVPLPRVLAVRAVAVILL
ncbi:MAG TPA: hypothetical protein VNU72_07290, partial [Puia sp.]|nr:hypothetical protein [Puia sp.]